MESHCKVVSSVFLLLLACALACAFVLSFELTGSGITYEGLENREKAGIPDKHNKELTEKSWKVER